MFAARRHIELALARRGGQVSLLALDWKKAFDSVSLSGVADALRRLGVPEHTVKMDARKAFLRAGFLALFFQALAEFWNISGMHPESPPVCLPHDCADARCSGQTARRGSPGI